MITLKVMIVANMIMFNTTAIIMMNIFTMVMCMVEIRISIKTKRIITVNKIAIMIEKIIDHITKINNDKYYDN